MHHARVGTERFGLGLRRLDSSCHEGARGAVQALARCRALIRSREVLLELSGAGLPLVTRAHGGGRRLISYANTPISCMEKRVGDPGVGSGKLLMLPVGTSPARLEARQGPRIGVV